MTRASKAVVAATYASMLLTGCRGQQSSPIPALGGPSGILTWSEPGDAKSPLPGIDRASIYHVGAAFVVWGGFVGSGVGSWSSGSQGVECHGYLEPHDGRRVEFRCEMKDGKAGRVTIDGTDYDLTTGGLFLISTRGGEVQVKQLKQDLSGLKFDQESLKAFAQGDPEIRDFFVGPAPRK